VNPRKTTTYQPVKDGQCKADPTRRATGARARAMGEALEKAALLSLHVCGCMAYRIATPTGMRRGKRIWTAPVCGDLFGLAVDGRGVLVECKHRTDEKGHPRRPRPSDFEKHQVEALRQWHRRGGLALVAYFDATRQVQMLPAVEIVGAA
jgi:hypothetical protein